MRSTLPADDRGYVVGATRARPTRPDDAPSSRHDHRRRAPRASRSSRRCPPRRSTYLAGAVEDIRLVPGEYFAHEGDERALFVVVEGGAEITKVVNGEERVIGARKPGQFFGEVPMTLSTPFPASGRAAEVARIIKLDVTVYYTLAAMAPSVPARVAGLARRYLDSLQAIAAEQPETEVRVIGPRLDARTHRGGRVPHAQPGRVRARRRSTSPVDGRAVPDPRAGRRRRLGRSDDARGRDAVGLDVEPSASEYDVVILGAGPAGLTAAVNGAAEGLRTVVIEIARARRAGRHLDPHRELHRIPVRHLGRRPRQPRAQAGEAARRRDRRDPDGRGAPTRRPARDRARRRRALRGAGRDRRDRRRVAHAAGAGRSSGSSATACTTGRPAATPRSRRAPDVCIIGAGNSAGQAALFFSRHARSVTMLVRGESLEASMSRYLIDQIAANDGIRVRDAQRGRRPARRRRASRASTSIDRDDRSDHAPSRTRSLFVMIGADAVTGWLPPEIARDAHGFILTGADAAATDAVDGRPSSVRARDERARRLRGRRRALGLGQARRGRRRRGRHGDRVRAPVPGAAAAHARGRPDRCRRARSGRGRSMR